MFPGIITRRVCESCFVFSAAIYDGATAGMANGGVVVEDGVCSHVGSVELDPSVTDKALDLVNVGRRHGERRS
jgi:hypothetical protein